MENKENKPFAEYWLGAHPVYPARLKEKQQDLHSFIEENKKEMLGDKVASSFGELPFLFKILDVHEMLSIQVHPNKQQAKEGYEKENAAGLKTNAYDRSFRDQNHKPELMVALSDFWLLHGFRPADDLRALLGSKKELKFLLEQFQNNNYKRLFEFVMTMPQPEVNNHIKILGDRITPLYASGSLSKDDPDHWAAKAIETFSKDDQFDRGIFSIYLLNLLHLKKGEAIFQGAGMPHAYLEGQNVEVMANSDNVLRGGLTDKHIDVRTLLDLVIFEPTQPAITRLQPGDVQEYNNPSEEFKLLQIKFTAQQHYSYSHAPSILFLLEGSLIIQTGGNDPLPLRKGQSVFIASGTDCLLSGSRDAVVFAVSVPE